jgi:hypothetical protein
LLAKRPAQSKQLYLTHRHRWQASSHRVGRCCHCIGNAARPCGSLASQLPQGWSVLPLYRQRRKTLWESGKPAPTGLVGVATVSATPQELVGAWQASSHRVGRCCHCIGNAARPCGAWQASSHRVGRCCHCIGNAARTCGSLASQLPQGWSVLPLYRQRRKTLWKPGKPAPTRVYALPNALGYTSNSVGVWLASDGAGTGSKKSAEDQKSHLVVSITLRGSP